MRDELADIVRPAAQQSYYKFPVVLDPDRLITIASTLPSLDWKSIAYGPEELGNIPDDCGGIYAFAIQHVGSGLTPHCYILYIGIAGKNSTRSLRDRYRDYLTPSKVRKRLHIARMIFFWQPILRFYFAPVSRAVSSTTLQDIERQLNSALTPPFSINDIDGEIRETRRAFP